MVAPERRGRAIAMVLMGLPVANVVGVPAATWLGQALGWRASYWVVAGLSALTIAMVLAFVPDCPGNPEATGRRELQALRMPQVWFAIVAGAVGFGGMFAVYTYLASTLADVTGVSTRMVPLVLAVFGVGMTIGNLVVPRFLALMIVTALFNIYALLFGIFGGVLATLTFGAPLGPFFATLLTNASTVDLWGSVVKTTLFGAIIAIVCSYKGMTASGGAEGVGRSVNQAVVIAFLGVFAFNYVFTQTLLATHPEISVIK
jgi:predicted MFS family arabinose efflux permease